MGRFGEVIVGNFLQIVNLRKKLMTFTAAYGQISVDHPLRGRGAVLLRSAGSARRS